MKRIRRAATARRHLDQRFRIAGDVQRHLAVPAKGWIRAIRESLGMTASQLAMRMDLSQSTLSEMEKAEARGAIQLSSLKRAGEAMNCTLVYALVPNETLETFFQTRARVVAIEQLRPVEQTMLIENAQSDAEATREQLDDYKRADYILYFKPNIPLALIEAKDNAHSVGDGLQQGLEYAATLDIPFVFSSNGDGFVFHDRIGSNSPTETTLALDAFPSPADLWGRYRSWEALDAETEQVVLQDYFDDGSGKAPRYYQVNAVNAAIEAIAKGRDRILLVMATGTGKTYTAFQILWRLWKGGRKKRIVYLADRNVLIDQTMVNDFRPFGGVMAKLSTRSNTIEKSDGTVADLMTAIDPARQINKSYEVYLGLYQAIAGPEERQKLFREFSPGFFDLIVIDECHRGSAAEDSAWREILEYFSSATQIGMTATPKETRYVSNIAYFGDRCEPASF